MGDDGFGRSVFGGCWFGRGCWFGSGCWFGGRCWLGSRWCGWSRFLHREDRLPWRRLAGSRRPIRRSRGFASTGRPVLQQAADSPGLVIADRAAVALSRDRQLVGSIQHVLVLKAKVLGQLVNSDFAAAGHSGGVSGRAGHVVPRWPHARQGQCSVCLSGFFSRLTEPLLHRRENHVGHLTTQGLLQSFPSTCVLQTCLRGAEIGRTTHSCLQENPIPVVADHAPEQALSLIHI